MDELLEQMRLLMEELAHFEIQYNLDRKIIHDRLDKITVDIEKMKKNAIVTIEEYKELNQVISERLFSGDGNTSITKTK